MIRNPASALWPALRAPARRLERESEGSLTDIQVQWGLGILATYALSFILPSLHAGYLRPLYLLASVLWCALAYPRIGRVPFAFPLAALLVLQVWSIVTAIHATYALGRSLGLGRADFFLAEHAVPYFVAGGLAIDRPKLRDRILLLFGAAFALSCLVGWLQFFKVPPALSLARFYTFKDIDYWDGTAGLRACGLAWHPGILAAQCGFGLAIVASRVFVERIRPWHVAAMFFFSGGLVFSQARAAYLVLAIVWPVFLWFLFRRNSRLAGRLIAFGLVCLAAAGLFATRRLGYALQSSSLEEDPSFVYRREVIWSQLDTAYPAHALTGIGPSAGLWLGTGPEDKYVPLGKVMESAYLAFLAMYGLPGLLMLIAAYAGSIGLAAALAFHRRMPPARRAMGLVGLATAGFIALQSYTGNTLDGYMIGPFAMIVCGLAAAGRGEVPRPSPGEGP
ncbi:MAG: O-antigen ligase family protein [Fimbriimonadales bacterium]|nr:O-antigen ligase family protein [Fimbriimonadales bacterium]